MMRPPRKIVVSVVCLVVLAGAAVAFYDMWANERRVTQEVTALRGRADRGDAQSEYDLAERYLQGDGIDQNDAQGAQWMLKAAGAGNVQAQFEAGKMSLQGEAVPQDYAAALGWFHKASDQGDARAMREIGSMIYFGAGVQTDFGETVKWYRRAADAGLAQAQYDLGTMYYRGVGVPKDRTEAAGWFKQAADQGNVEAAKTLASMYNEGDGVPMDPPEAELLLKQAAKSRGENSPAHAVHRGMTSGAMTALAIHFLLGAGLVAAYFLDPDRFTNYGRLVVLAAAALCFLQAGLSWLGGAFRWFGTLQEPSAFAIAYFVLDCALACLLIYVRVHKDGARAPAAAPREAPVAAAGEEPIAASSEDPVIEYSGVPAPDEVAVTQASESLVPAADPVAQSID